jgi:MoaA/NifB/PqqE/SkfB family radical SAM enzyme
MCSIWKSTDTAELTPARLQSYLPDMHTLGVETVVLTGGEPLMNSHLPELCAMLREVGVRVTVLTTGLLLARFAEMLARSTDEVIVSLDGPSEVHDRIRRVAGCYALLAAGVKGILAADASFRVTARCTVQKLNCSSLRATVDAARSIGFRAISFLAADVTSTAFNRAAGITDPVALDLTEIDALQNEIETMDLAGGFVVESREKLRRIVLHFRAHLGLVAAIAPRCNAPWVSTVIETDGSVRPCFFHQTIGQANGTGFADALNSAAAVEFRTRLRIADDAVCRRCVCSLWRGAAAH